MTSRVLLVSSAAVMGVVGIVATFLPQELLVGAGLQPTPPGPALIQVAGALYLGFAMLNWMNRGNRHGGIYGRPLVVANLLQFWAAGLALVKDASSSWVVGAGALSIAFGVAFAVRLFGDPGVD